MKKKKQTKIGAWKTVYKGRLFEIEHAPVTLPDGSKKTYERARRARTTIVLPVDNQGRLLLIKEYFEEIKRYEWNLPAGKLEPGESPKAGAIRELREEIGIRPKKLTLLHKGEAFRAMVWDRYHFLATGLVRDPLKNNEFEDITVFPTDLKKAFEMAMDGTIKQEMASYLIARLYINRKKLLPQLFGKA